MSGCFGVFARLSFVATLWVFVAPVIVEAQVNTSIVATRTSCVAPCGIFFDGTATTHVNSGVDAFSELSYHWAFDDTAAVFVNRPGVNANESSGALAAHVFAEPGSYTVRLTAEDASGNSDAAQLTVNVSDPNQVFDGSLTRCVSSSGNFSGCPSGAIQTTSSNFNTQIDWVFAANSRRLLFRRGETFTSTASSFHSSLVGPYLIAAFGNGADPIITGNSNSNSTLLIPHQGENVSITSLHFQSSYDPATGLGVHPNAISMNGGMRHATIFRNSFDGLGLNLHLGQSEFFDDSVIADNSITKWQNYGCLTGDLTRVSFIGNSIKQSANATHNPDGKNDNTPNWADHGPIRVRNGVKVQISKNDFFNNVGWVGLPQPNIRLGTGGTADLTIVSENILSGGGSVAASVTANDTAVVNPGQVIWERNTWNATDVTRTFFATRFGGALVRNNLFLRPVGARALADVIHAGTNTNSTNDNTNRTVRIYGNTAVAQGTEGFGRFLRVSENSLSNFDLKNNIVSAADPDFFVVWSSSSNVAGLQSNNNIFTSGAANDFARINGSEYTLSAWQATGRDGNTLLANPLFVDSAAANFQLQSSSPARDAGASLNVLFEDFSGGGRPVGAGTDIGAFEFGNDSGPGGDSIAPTAPSNLQVLMAN